MRGNAVRMKTIKLQNMKTTTSRWLDTTDNLNVGSNLI